MLWPFIADAAKDELWGYSKCPYSCVLPETLFEEADAKRAITPMRQGKRSDETEFQPFSLILEMNYPGIIVC